MVIIFTRYPIEVPLLSTHTHHPLSHLFPVPLKAALEWTLVLVYESQSVTKLVEDGGSIHKPQVHGEGLQRYPSGVGPNVRPRTSCMEHTQVTDL